MNLIQQIIEAMNNGGSQTDFNDVVREWTEEKLGDVLGNKDGTNDIFGSNNSGGASATGRYGDVLNNMDNRGTSNDDLTNFFSQIVGEQGAGRADEREAWLNRLMDWLALLNERSYNEGLTADQRAYDKSLLQDQRAYESPVAMLGRLMATGMSREQALQMLSGGSSASAIGASSPLAAGSLAAGSAASPSSEFANIASGTNSLVGSLEGLANIIFTGMSVPQTLAQNAISKNAALNSNMQVSAQDSVGKFINALYARGKNGQYLSAPTQEQSASLESLMKYAGSVPEAVNPALYEFMNGSGYSSMMSNPLATNLLTSQFSSMSDAQRNRLDTDILTQSRLLQLEERLKGINVEQSLLDYQWDTSKFDDYGLSRNLVNQLSVMEFSDKLDLLRASRTPEQLKFRIDKLKNDNQFMAMHSALQLQKEQLLSSLQNTPEGKGILGMCYFLDQCGFTGEVGQVAKAVGAVTGFVTGAFDHGDNVLHAIGEQIENSKPILPSFNPSAIFGDWKSKFESVYESVKPYLKFPFQD